MSGSGREALPDVREWSGRPRGCPGVIGRPSRMSGIGRKAIPTSESGQEVLRNVLEWSGGPPGCPRVVGMLSEICGIGREALPDVRK